MNITPMPTVAQENSRRLLLLIAIRNRNETEGQVSFPLSNRKKVDESNMRIIIGRRISGPILHSFWNDRCSNEIFGKHSLT
uniref:Uncharacterized protein n=1 Tax=Romanomermis culicivorax TaxID=13658 RepID=A0A915HM41_ROMCU